jgi:hypothetical protein
VGKLWSYLENQLNMSRGNKTLLALGLVLAAAGLSTSTVAIYRSGFWRGPDVQFGDQHLKTAVALITESSPVSHAVRPQSHQCDQDSSRTRSAPRSGFVRLSLATDVARYVAVARVRYHCASRATPLKRGPLDVARSVSGH